MVLRKLPGRGAVSMLLAALTTAMLLISCAADANSSSSDTNGNGGGGTTTSGVTSVTLDRSTANVLVGNEFTLIATVNASEGVATTVSWSSSDSTVASVAEGKVTANAAGEATITATSTADATKKATCVVTVGSSAVSSGWTWTATDYSDGITADKTTINADTVMGNVTVSGGGATWRVSDSAPYCLECGKTTNGCLTFTTTDTATITIVAASTGSSNVSDAILSTSKDTTGAVSEKTGATTVTGSNPQTKLIYENVPAGTYYFGAFPATTNGRGIRVYSISVEYASGGTSLVYPSGITLSKSSLTLDLNSDSTSETLTATITNASEVTNEYDTINWSSSDTSVATVTDGLVTAKKAGTATITAAAKYGTASATCTVTVTGTSSVDLVVTPGAKVTTYGWADLANDGAGMSYPDTTNIIVIDDTTYTTATSKCTAFTNAIASGSVTSSSVNSTKAIIVLKGEVDLSVNTITDGKTVKEWFAEFDDITHKREHEDIVYDIGSNKAIIGVNGAKLSHGGLRIYAKSGQPGENIIIQNVEFSDAHGSTEYDTSVSTYSSKKASADALVIEASGASSGVYSYVPQNIWIDHCKFSDGDCRDMIRNYNHDGAFDMKAGKNVTVSYCEFTNHDKVTLLAPDDSYTSTEQRQITFHHIYYHDTVQRTPRSRGCQLHIYNCYYDTIGFNGTDDNGSGSNGGFMFGPGINSQYIVENCYLGSMVNSSAKKMKYFDTSSGGSSASTFSKFYQSGNSYTFTGSSDIATDDDTASSVADHLTTTKPWTPAYSYESTMSTYSEVQTLVPNAAGTDKSGYTATVSVNGVVY